ncbi:MAG: RNA 2',3'-cyclic phosphodiesterase [Gammaproteobacteria bacterium]|nr:RNA 2',3'-cyclic phosphodiesterase [Gammaproteobacteria bacterium]
MSSGAEPESGGPCRVFYALWPTAAVRDAFTARIQTLAAAAPARWVPPENLHLTLWFVGPVAPATLQRLLNAPAMPGAGFMLAFARLRYHRRRQLLWVEPECPVPAWSALISRLVEWAGPEVKARDPHSPFPHVTLARKLVLSAPLPSAVEPVTWPVDSVALVESVLQLSGPPRYRVLRRWSLCSMPAAGSMK